MLFQVTTYHDHKHCPTREGGFSSELFQNTHKWIKGSDEVKIHGAWASPTSHTSYGVVESNEMGSMVDLFKEPMLNGNVEITPIVNLKEIQANVELAELSNKLLEEEKKLERKRMNDHS